MFVVHQTTNKDPNTLEWLGSFPSFIHAHRYLQGVCGVSTQDAMPWNTTKHAGFLTRDGRFTIQEVSY